MTTFVVFAREGGHYARPIPAVKPLRSGWPANYYESIVFVRGGNVTRPQTLRYNANRRVGNAARFEMSVCDLPKVLQAELGRWPYRHWSVNHDLCETFPVGVHCSYCLHCPKRRSVCQGFQRPRRGPEVFDDSAGIP